jgi:hypothetical protein
MSDYPLLPAGPPGYGEGPTGRDILYLNIDKKHKPRIEGILGPVIDACRIGCYNAVTLKTRIAGRLRA